MIPRVSSKKFAPLITDLINSPFWAFALSTYPTQFFAAKARFVLYKPTKGEPITMNSKTTALKASRLIENHRVILVAYGQALVIGSHDTYHVNKTGHRYTCNRPWGRHKNYRIECSHIQAVRKALKDPASQVPVDRIAELLDNAIYFANLKESA